MRLEILQDVRNFQANSEEWGGNRDGRGVVGRMGGMLRTCEGVIDGLWVRPFGAGEQTREGRDGRTLWASEGCPLSLQLRACRGRRARGGGYSSPEAVASAESPNLRGYVRRGKRGSKRPDSYWEKADSPPYPFRCAPAINPSSAARKASKWGSISAILTSASSILPPLAQSPIVRQRRAMRRAPMTSKLPVS